MADFDIAYNHTRPLEGGYSNPSSAQDKGGETYIGIARNFNPNWAGWAIIDAYKAKHGAIAWNTIINDANLDLLHKQYAKDKFWDAIKGDDIANQDIANLVFDVQWIDGAEYVTQRAINNLLPSGSKIAEDGVIGNDTLNKINSLPQSDLYAALRDAQKSHFEKVAYGNNLTGWLHRLASFPTTISDAVVSTVEHPIDTFSKSPAKLIIAIATMGIGIALLFEILVLTKK